MSINIFISANFQLLTGKGFGKISEVFTSLLSETVSSSFILL